MSGLFLLVFGLLGQWLLGVAVAHLLLRSRCRAERAGASISVVFRSAKERLFAERKATNATVVSAPVLSDSTEEPPWAELAGLGLVLGIGLTAWGLFVWSLCGGTLGRGASLTVTVLGLVCGGPIVWTRLRPAWSRHSRAAHRKSQSRSANSPLAPALRGEGQGVRGSWIASQASAIEIDERREAAWRRLCQWLIVGLTVAALAQTLLTPHHFWDERSIFAIKGLVLAADGSIRSPDLLDPDFVQYHPRYPLLIPLAEQHVYALLGGVDDRLSKIVFPLLYLGLVLTMAGVISRHFRTGAAWLFALLLATVPVLMPYELGFLSGQADAPIACFHGIALLYMWDACARHDSPTPTRSVSEDASASEVTIAPPLANAAVNRTDSRREAASFSFSLTFRDGVNAASQRVMGASIIAGLCGALAAFTKDEGIAFLLVDVAALSLVIVVGFVLKRHHTGASDQADIVQQTSSSFRTLVAVVVCAVIVLGPWFVHRRGLPLTTEMNYFGRASFALVIERLPVLAWEAVHLAHRMLWEWQHWGLHWWLMLVALVIAPRRVLTASQMVLLLDMVGSLLALMIAGMLAPAQLDEHIGGSSPRFLMQLVPVAVLFAAGQLAPRREARLSLSTDGLV